MIKQIPKNIKAEEAILGSILIDEHLINKVSETLDAKDFYRQSHKTVFNAMVFLNNKNNAIDILTLTEYLNNINKLEEVGGIAFITSLPNKVPSTANINYYVNIVREKSFLRKISYIGENIANWGYNNENNTPEFILDKIEEMLSKITKKMVVTKVDNIQGQTLKAYMDKDIPVIFFSLEMSSSQLIHRIFSCRGLIEMPMLKSGKLNNQMTQDLIDISNKLSRSKLIIQDDIFNLAALRSIARKLKRENDIKLIIIDYLQLLEGNNRENRNLEISEISRSLKLLAKELDIPIIALSQLSRSVESRQVKKPILSDLRESGSLEQDADIVMFLYREDYYIPETENKNITEVIIAKNRNGPTGSIPVFFHKEYLRFQDLED